MLGNYGGLGRHIAGIVIGMVVAGAIALAVGLLSFSQGESDPFYIAIVTLALTVVAGTLYGQTTQWTGGDNGLFGFAYHGYSGTTWYYICAALLIVIAAGALALVRSDFGLVIKAIRDNQRRVRFFGTNVEAVKIGVFVLGAVLAALAGGVYATIVGFVSAPLFGFLFSTQILIWVAVGGRGTIIGPVLGAIGLSFVTSKLNASYPTEWSLFLGLLFVTVVVFVPDGVFPPLGRLGRSLLHRRRPARVSRVLTSAPRSTPELRPRGEAVTVVSELEFSYGALEVLRGVDFEIKAGELLCIVGPNGAGKSTLLNVLTDGKLPARGSIEYHLHAGELTRRGKAIHRLARAGIARKFQIPHLFDSLTVAETILLASRKGRIPSLYRRTKEIPVAEVGARHRRGNGPRGPRGRAVAGARPRPEAGPRAGSGGLRASRAAAARRADRRADEQRAPRDRRRLPPSGRGRDDDRPDRARPRFRRARRGPRDRPARRPRGRVRDAGRGLGLRGRA